MYLALSTCNNAKYYYGIFSALTLPLSQRKVAKCAVVVLRWVYETFSDLQKKIPKSALTGKKNV